MATAKRKRKTSAEYREDWLDRKWRPAMGWMYFTVCVCDFVIFPIIWSVFMAKYGTSTNLWSPLTLQGGGLFHISMGAVLGVAAWTRGQEKLTRYQYGYGDAQMGFGGGGGYQSEEYSDEVAPLEPVADTKTEFYRYNR